MSGFTEEQRAELVEIILAVLEASKAAAPQVSTPLEVDPADEDAPADEGPDPHRPFIYKVLGIKASPPPVIIQEDGSKYQAYPRQRGDDWYWIELGVSDVSAKVWNSYDITYGISDKQKRKNLMTYDGGLRQKLSDWPDDKRETFLEGHPNWGNDGSKK